jgi:hypothetical protein
MDFNKIKLREGLMARVERKYGEKIESPEEINSFPKIKSKEKNFSKFEKPLIKSDMKQIRLAIGKRIGKR